MIAGWSDSNNDLSGRKVIIKKIYLFLKIDILIVVILPERNMGRLTEKLTFGRILKPR